MSMYPTQEELLQGYKERVESLKAEIELLKQPRKRWISVKDRLPEMDVPVWLYCPQFHMNPIFIGCRAEADEGWFWCNVYGTAYYHKAWTCDDAEMDDDYQPTYWQPLPSPPEEE